MDAPLLTLLLRWHFDRRGATWRDVAAGLLYTLLVMPALFLLARRAAGALVQPPAAGLLLLVGICVACVVTLVRLLVHNDGAASRDPLLARARQWGPTAAVAMYGIALSLPDSSPAALFVYWLLIVGADVAAERLLSGQARGVWPGSHGESMPTGKAAISGESQVDETLLDEPLAAVPGDTSLARRISPTVPPATAPLAELPGEDVWQQMTRTRDAAGEEVISGWLRAEFQPGERTATLHVAFCPPLAHTPELHVEQTSGPPARIKTAQLLPHGARFEIRLTTPAPQPEMLLLEFVAQPGGDDNE